MALFVCNSTDSNVKLAAGPNAEVKKNVMMESL